MRGILSRFQDEIMEFEVSTFYSTHRVIDLTSLTVVSLT